MPSIRNFLSFVRLGLMDPGLMSLAYHIKGNKRTYLSYSTLFSLANNFHIVHQRNSKPVQAAEFGVGRGGSASILAWMVNRYGGKLSLFDVYDRIPAPTENDGKKALTRYEYILQQEGEEYYGNINNLLDVIRNDLFIICDPKKVEFIKGKYEDTLPLLDDKRDFDLVHIDCDWYESSKAVYVYLRTRLRPGAIIQVDDFSNWKGSKQAFEEQAWLAQYQTHIVDGALVVDTSRMK